MPRTPISHADPFILSPPPSVRSPSMGRNHVDLWPHPWTDPGFCKEGVQEQLPVLQGQLHPLLLASSHSPPTRRVYHTMGAASRDFKSSNQVRIFPLHSVPPHFPSVLINTSPSHHPPLPTTATVSTDLGCLRGRRLQSHPYPTPTGLHIKLSSARVSSINR